MPPPNRPKPAVHRPGMLRPMPRPGGKQQPPKVGKGKAPKGRGLKLRPLPRDKQLVAPPSGTLTYGQLGRDTQAAKDLQFSDQRRVLNQAAGDVQVGQGAITNWFDQYKRDVAAGGQAQQAQLGQAQADLAARNQQGQAADTARLGQIDAQNRADAQSRGAQYTPDSSAAQAQGSRQQLTDAFANMLSSQGAARSGYAADRGSAASGAQLSARLGQQRVGQKINQQRSDLANKEGTYATKYKADAIAKEQEAALAKAVQYGNQVTKGQQTQLGYAKLKSDQRSKAKQLMSTDQYHAGLLKQGADRNAIARYKATHQKSGTKTKTVSNSAKIRNINAFNKGLEYLRTGAGKGQSSVDALRGLQAGGEMGANVENDIANALIEWRDNNGQLSPQTRQYLTKERGIPVPGAPKRKRK